MTGPEDVLVNCYLSSYYTASSRPTLWPLQLVTPGSTLPDLLLGCMLAYMCVQSEGLSVLNPPS